MGRRREPGPPSLGGGAPLLHRERRALDPGVPLRRPAAGRDARDRRREPAPFPGRALCSRPRARPRFPAGGSRWSRRTTGTWHGSCGRRAAAASAWTPSGRTTSTIRCAACWRGTETATTRTSRTGSRIWRRSCATAGCSPARRRAAPALRGARPRTASPRERFVFCSAEPTIRSRQLRPRRFRLPPRAIDAASYRAASVLLLTAPQTPLLFMGQEMGASSTLVPVFHRPRGGLGASGDGGTPQGVRGLRELLRSGEAGRHPRPPGGRETFRRSVLDWSERARAGARGSLSLHRELFRLRRVAEPAGRASRGFGRFSERQRIGSDPRRPRALLNLIVVQLLRGEGRVELGGLWDLAAPAVRADGNFPVDGRRAAFCADPLAGGAAGWTDSPPGGRVPAGRGDRPGGSAMTTTDDRDGRRPWTSPGLAARRRDAADDVPAAAPPRLRLPRRRGRRRLSRRSSASPTATRPRS